MRGFRIGFILSLSFLLITSAGFLLAAYYPIPEGPKAPEYPTPTTSSALPEPLPPGFQQNFGAGALGSLLLTILGTILFPKRRVLDEVRPHEHDHIYEEPALSTKKGGVPCGNRNEVV